MVRPATLADLPSIATIYAHYVARSTVTFELVPPDEREWMERFRAVGRGGLPFLVAEQDAQLVGYAYCAPWKAREAYRGTVEDSIYVAPGATSRGVGGALLAALLAECEASGVREVIAVIVDSDDPASVQLHTRCGFVEAGRLRRVGFKHDRWLDTLLLQRSLGGGRPPVDLPGSPAA
jgi:L-amino acid N-acyltransferase YncA